VLHDRYYYAARATEERQIAMGSVVLKARMIHLELATRYDALAGGKRLAQALVAAEPLPDGGKRPEPAASSDETNATVAVASA
jgi:hypothetical protein